MRSMRSLRLILSVTLIGFGCGTKESASEPVRVMPSKARGEPLGRTLLHLAPNGQVAERLIAQGFDVNAQGSFGMTPLHSAAHAGTIDLVELLTAHGAEVDAKGRGHAGIVEMLRQHGAKGIVELELHECY